MRQRKSMRYAMVLALWFVMWVGLATAAPAAPAAPAAINAPSLWASPREFAFGPVGVGEVSPPIAVTFTNLSDNSFLSPFGGGQVGAPFLREDECNLGLAAKSTCRMLFRFAPEAAGPFTATTTVTTDAGPVTLVMHGRGVPPKLHLTPLAIDFGPARTNDMGTARSFTITNVGRGHLDIQDVSQPGGPYTVTPDCAGGLDAGESCPVQVRFLPTAEGRFAATITVISNGGQGSVQVVGLGRATLPAVGQNVSPTVLDFGPVGVGVTAPTQRVTFVNLSQTAHLIDWSGGTVAAPFARTTTCQDDIDPATSCAFDFSFVPTAAGAFSATVSVTNNLGTVTIELRGQGVGPQVTADTLLLEFPPVAPGTTSPAQVVTFRNSGLAPAQMFGGAPQPRDTFAASTTCGAVMSPGDTCQVNYLFKPQAFGRFNGTSQFSLSATGQASNTVRLVGGAAPPALALRFDPAVVDPGQTARLRLSLGNNNTSLALTHVTLAAQLPAGLVFADPPLPNVGGGCDGASFMPVAGSRALSFSGGMLGGQTCELAVSVVAAARGAYTVQATANSDSGPSNGASALLGVGVDFTARLPFVKRSQ